MFWTHIKCIQRLVVFFSNSDRTNICLILIYQSMCVHRKKGNNVPVPKLWFKHYWFVLVESFEARWEKQSTIKMEENVMENTCLKMGENIWGMWWEAQRLSNNIFDICRTENGWRLFGAHAWWSSFLDRRNSGQIFGGFICAPCSEILEVKGWVSLAHLNRNLFLSVGRRQTILSTRSRMLLEASVANTLTSWVGIQFLHATGVSCWARLGLSMQAKIMIGRCQHRLAGWLPRAILQWASARLRYHSRCRAFAGVETAACSGGQFLQHVAIPRSRLWS